MGGKGINMRIIIRKTSDFLNEIFKIVSLYLLLLIIAFVSIGIFFRFVLNQPLGWIMELTKLLFVWMNFLGFTIVCKHRSHLKIIGLRSILERNNVFKKIIEGVENLIFFIISIILIFGTIDYIKTIGYSPSPSLPIPSYIWVLAAGVCGVTIIIHIFSRIFFKCRGQLT